MDRYMLFPSGMGQHQNGSYVLFADAQATIAALQAQLTQLDRTLADVYAQRDGLQKDLAQRTAELEAAKADRDELQSVFDLGHTRTVEADKLWQEAHGKPEVCPDLGELVGWLMRRYDDLQAELEALRAWRDYVTVALQRPGGAFFVDVPQHIKDLVKERDELRTLVLALPKVEGEIADETILDLWESDAITFDALRGLLQHRQGME